MYVTTEFANVNDCAGARGSIATGGEVEEDRLTGHSTTDAGRHAGERGGISPSHEGHGGKKSFVGHTHHGGHADHAAMFRSRFWVSLVLSVPVVLYGHMVQMWLRVIGHPHRPVFVVRRRLSGLARRLAPAGLPLWSGPTQDFGTLSGTTITRRGTSTGRHHAAGMPRGRDAMLTSLSLAAGCVDGGSATSDSDRCSSPT
jgi:hypothetical protein